MDIAPNFDQIIEVFFHDINFRYVQESTPILPIGEWKQLLLCSPQFFLERHVYEISFCMIIKTACVLSH